jgi:hypothetical protein
MLRNLGISLLMLGLLGTAIDGFRLRDRARTSPGTNATTTAPEVHVAEGATMPPN